MTSPTDDDHNDCRIHPKKEEQEQQQENQSNDDDDPELQSVVPDQCNVIMAMSSIPNGGWGVFSSKATKLTRGMPVMGGDVIIQVHDLPAHHVSLKLMSHVYWWDASETGGVYEGLRVVSQIPGLGMLANGLDGTNAHVGANVLPFIPRIDEGGLTRWNSPGAGAITHYHNYTWFVLHNISQGDEIFVAYGSNWFAERRQQYRKQFGKGVEDGPLMSFLPINRSFSSSSSDSTEENSKGYDDQSQTDARIGHRPVQELRREGRCLDAFRAGRSSIPHAGRGAFVRWDIAAGQVVSAVPVIPIAKIALLVKRAKDELNPETGEAELFQAYQLLLNYVLGHAESSTVLIPYGPMFSLINHASTPAADSNTTSEPEDSYKNNMKKHNKKKNQQVVPTPNVRLQWSTSKTLFRHREWLSINSTEELWMRNESGLLFDLVATRDIKAGEEVLMDYGPAWDAAWQAHVQQWKPPPNAESYAPSYVHDDAIVQARTEKELQDHPYPDHIFTSCFFPVNETVQKQILSGTSGANDKSSVTTVKWELTRGMFEFSNMRPCRVIERHGTKYKDVFFYTVQILNRYGLRPGERLSSPLIVTHVPRKAIRFSDKIYTTDQHLPHAFRHTIGLPDDIFPDAWKDLKTMSDD
ncbi:hypothetical protein ACA910_021924 [Epithemia clementina (nom. ined.)]